MQLLLLGDVCIHVHSKLKFSPARKAPAKGLARPLLRGILAFLNLRLYYVYPYSSRQSVSSFKNFLVKSVGVSLPVFHVLQLAVYSLNSLLK